MIYIISPSKAAVWDLVFDMGISDGQWAQITSPHQMHDIRDARYILHRRGSAFSEKKLDRIKTLIKDQEWQAVWE